MPGPAKAPKSKAQGTILALKRQVEEQKRQIAQQGREIRMRTAHEQDTAERYRASPDADGIAGHTADVTYRDKNAVYVSDVAHRAPFYPAILGGSIGETVALYRHHLSTVILAFWVGPLDSAPKVRLHHELRRWLTDGRLKIMLRDDTIGRAEVNRYYQTAIDLAFAFSVPFVHRTSQEIQVDPVEAERRPTPVSVAAPQ